ncbi:MAG: MATE family efflux transporter [Lachnospiraceae bacterium]|nr:MATE family efflux transporter [Lachnospiraceae bacterium]
MRKYIGTKQFYKNTLTLMIPMVIQNVVTNFVSMLDNIMVGQLGTAPMSGVSIVNQFIFIFNLTLFGSLAGPTIFGAQFYGKGDHEGQKQTMRFRMIAALCIIVLFATIYLMFTEPLLSLYISKNDDAYAKAKTLAYGMEYMKYIVISMLPFGISQAYSSVIRECGETKIPMIGSLMAVLVNLVLDYGLIFGKLGMPCLGVKGAAIATVVAKTVEAMVVVFWAHTHQEKNRYIPGLYRGFAIEPQLCKHMFRKGLPLLINEFLWVAGVSAIAQCYSVRGLDVVGARNIAMVIVNLFGVIYIQIGAATSIILGNTLGAGKLKEAEKYAGWLMAFALFVSTVVGLIAFPTAFWFPNMYNTTGEILELATYIILTSAVCMPMWSYSNVCYNVLRSGGKTGITFLFDFVFTWGIQIPICYFLAYHTQMPFKILYVVVIYTEIIKDMIGYFMVKSGFWVQNIVEKVKV